MKICSKCKQTKSLEEFYPNPKIKDGRQSHCKECNKAYARTDEARKRRNTKAKKYFILNEAKVRDYKLKRTYGISFDDYNKILLEQDGKCFICGRTPKQIRKKKLLSVDHCHSTGKIRGLLCSNCNRAVVPLFEKQPERAERLYEYLTREKHYGFVPERKEK